jgi:hypothetical protein
MDAAAAADGQMRMASPVNPAYGFTHVQTAGQGPSDMG